MSSRFVNPFTDLGFKIIFGQPASKVLLIILLNELLSGDKLGGFDAKGMARANKQAEDKSQ